MRAQLTHIISNHEITVYPHQFKSREHSLHKWIQSMRAHLNRMKSRPCCECMHDRKRCARKEALWRWCKQTNFFCNAGFKSLWQSLRATNINSVVGSCRARCDMHTERKLRKSDISTELSLFGPYLNLTRQRTRMKEPKTLGWTRIFPCAWNISLLNNVVDPYERAQDRGMDPYLSSVSIHWMLSYSNYGWPAWKIPRSWAGPVSFPKLKFLS